MGFETYTRSQRENTPNMKDDDDNNNNNNMARRASMDKSAHTTSSISSDITPEPSYPGSDDDAHDGHAPRRASLGSVQNRKHPCPMALLGLDVIRQAMRIIATMIDQPDVSLDGASNEDNAEGGEGGPTNVRDMWNELMRFQSLERMLETGYCKLIDEKYHGGDGGACDILEKHTVLDEYVEDVQEAMSAKNLDGVKYYFPIFQSETLRFLDNVQIETLPILKKMEKRGEPVHKYLGKLVHAVMKPDDLEFFVKFANETLFEDASREFNLTLWWIMSPQDWRERGDELVQAYVKTPEEYQELYENIEDYKVDEKFKSCHNSIGDVAAFKPPVAFIEIIPEDKKKKGFSVSKLFGTSQRRKSNEDL